MVNLCNHQTNLSILFFFENIDHDSSICMFQLTKIMSLDIVIEKSRAFENSKDFIGIIYIKF